ncbi:hypothetical protein D9758_012370 [Tetrapyrgos nigripes]|uniref:Uncharacterized protein n=1 Tax=Tetrapyrgos nigripes TaxID=182062 RepID=A0A8H5CM13_9AGAR|nr:hypothetical protein D9758_012370 [Tetrapyrgos nigripes]
MTNSAGRVLFTSDIWSCTTLASHVAVTAHYLAYSLEPGHHLILCSELVAFCIIHSSHTGQNIATIILDIGVITLDTLMTHVAEDLDQLDIPFSVEGNHIRCFPHIINIAVKTALKYLTCVNIWDPEAEGSDDPDLPAPSALNDDPEYKVIADAWTQVTTCQASGQHRQAMSEIIVEGNKNGGWGNLPEQLRNIELMKDVDTHWGAAFNMMDRLLELNLEVVSAEKTPTLSVVLPLYEQLITYLENLKPQLPKIEHSIQAAITKLKEYLVKSCKVKVYALAMALNLMFKFEWMEKHWTEREVIVAKEAALMLYAAHAQQSGLARFAVLGQTPESSPGSSETTPPLTPDQIQARQCQEDIAAVSKEIGEFKKAVAIPACTPVLIFSNPSLQVTTSEANHSNSEAYFPHQYLVLQTGS